MATLSLEVSPSVAEDFDALSVEDRRAVALWVAVQVGQLRKGTCGVDASTAYDAVTGRLSAQAKKAGLTPAELSRLIDEGR